MNVEPYQLLYPEGVLRFKLGKGVSLKPQNPYPSLRRKEGRVEKKARAAPAGPGARTRDLPRARRGSPAARQGGLFRQASLSVPIDRVGRLRNTMRCVFWR